MEWLIAILSGWIVQETIKEATELTNNSGGTNMLGGLPVEMITMLGSSVLGGFMTIWGQSIKAKQEAQKMLLARGKFQMEEIDKARRYENKGIQFTRRIIALTAEIFIIVWPKLVLVFFET